MPPVIEKVPTAVPIFVMVGDAVSVTGPAVAPVAVLLTVIVPVCVVVVPVTNDGVGPVNAAVAPVIVKATFLLFPPSVVTLTFCAPGRLQAGW